MSVEGKIRELLNKKQLSEETLDEAEAMGNGSSKKDTSIKAKVTGDTTNPTQGSSQPNVSYAERDGNADENQGAKVESNPKDDFTTTNGQSGPGAAPNFTTVADPASVVNQPSSKGNVQKESLDDEDEDLIDDKDGDENEDGTEDLDEDVDFSADLATLFDGNEDLTEEFRGKAASLFEAMVSARVSNEIAQIEETLVTEAAELMEEFKTDLVEKVDSYLSYVVEQWVEENQLAVENSLKNDITESFINGLKNLFKEHYVDVPEESYDVLGEMQDQIADLTAKLDETLAANVELHADNVELQKESVFSVVAENLAKTDAEKFKSLIADVEFENAEIFEEKLNVIKENYFPKSRPLSEEKLDDGVDNEFIEGTVGHYVKALDAMASKI
mgnify:CR=1 FL=1